MIKKAKAFSPYIIMFGFTVVLSMSTHFFIKSTDFGHDSGIFAYVGFAVTQGKALYTEAWDNKGPLLYLIEALGILIHYRYGIFLLEFVSLFSSVFLLYKTAALFVTKGVSVVCALLSMMLLTATLEGGNLAEEYALPFTILGFYYIAKFLKNNFMLKKYEMMLVGMCISAVFLLRMNILALLGCAVLGVIIILIINKQYKVLGNVFLFAFLGFALFIAPFVIYLLSKGVLAACIDTAYFGILGSFSDITMKERKRNVVGMILQMAPSGALLLIITFVLCFVCYSLKCKMKNKTALDQLGWIAFFGLLATLLANSLSGAPHMHYFMSFIPALIIPAVWIAKQIEEFINRNCSEKCRKNGLNTVVCSVLLVAVSFSCILYFFMDARKSVLNSFSSQMATTEEKVVDYIVNNTETTDTIQVFGGASAVSSYYGARRLAASKYFYYSNGRFSEEAKTEFAQTICADLEENPPKLIMFDSNYHDKELTKQEDFLLHCGDPDAWNAFLAENYTEQETDFGFIVYLRK
ncbi:MAG: hypothetical protein IK118_11035 [Clostridia bacterium]|nr:hypothetical protein [Clostridia bacterium]